MTKPNPIDEAAITEYVDAHIVEFHRRRLDRLNQLDLKSLLKRKNPYLFRSKWITGPHDLIVPMMDAHLSSQEEGMFGNFLEGLAIRAAAIAYGGRKSGITGIDLELEKDSVRYIVSIKSGPNWGNSSQIAKMRSDFRNATQVIRQGNPALSVTAINGCCYGQTLRNYDKGDYLKLAGQSFWEFLTGDGDFYLRIVRPIAHMVRERNQAFDDERALILRRLENEFAEEFCDPVTGKIDWEKLVRFNAQAAVRKD